LCAHNVRISHINTPVPSSSPLSLLCSIYYSLFIRVRVSYTCHCYGAPQLEGQPLPSHRNLLTHTYGAPQLEGQPDSFAFTHRNLLTHTSVLATVLLNLRASLIPLPSHRATFSHTPTNQPHTRVRRTERGGVRPARLALMLWSSTT
jgi:hypothetical protein